MNKELYAKAEKIALMSKADLTNEFSRLGVKFIAKKNSKLMRFISWFVGKQFMSYFWTTVRYTVYYPTVINDPFDDLDTLKHELTHMYQLDNMGGIDLPDFIWVAAYLFFPIPAFLAYFRWRAEREAYLVSLLILKKYYKGDDSFLIMKAEEVVQTLWSGYAYCWPRFLMRKWFAENLW